MKKYTPIDVWAHMLDECSNEKSLTEDVAAGNTQDALPKDENTKFRFSDVLRDGATAKELELVFDAIWPKWANYFDDIVSKEDVLEVPGKRNDIDDWDAWEISVEDCYGGMDEMPDYMFDNLQERWPKDKVVTLKEVIDAEARRLIDSATDDISLETLERYGRCTYSGSSRYRRH